MVKIGIYGGSGYTGQELLRLLLNHPDCEVTAITSRRYRGTAVPDLYPHFRGLTDLEFMDASPEAVAEFCDAVFLAVPHGEAMDSAPRFLEARKKVIDLSADFRLRDPVTYEKWYLPHRSPELLPEAVYGLPELYRDAITEARLTANPGCYPTCAILGLAPLLKGGWIDSRTLIIDAKSGASGAGRTLNAGTLFCEVNEGFKAYKVGAHRHRPEIEQELSLLAGFDIRVIFTPHLIPANRGILSTMYGTPAKNVRPADLIEVYREFYSNAPFVRICDEGIVPSISSVKGSNFCDLGIAVDDSTGQILVISAIDNLIKGAAGQAIQNMNIMFGLPEDRGLGLVPLFP
ncbi:MAG: N-acetyl-gamma-glutamyl-phosphate reductase [Syntrophales bacterium]|jgi:N-acetyl-gamma-glutamyl-phosphate reductase|nr:N-acetyl-gamma-glutamyl-phosphate reductase [Syntrophales bacterium]MCK9527896.1 N-acetyl-gamma-glutamyl-phosphate reductase [Syntrophales bacterium]MDX9921929.1 N-acetyl-gamma-glutamyl-phosphate reductase [Syntrophales bacterium]